MSFATSYRYIANSNAAQVQKEIKANGTATHPYAEHISDVATQKIDNLPDGFGSKGSFFILEETYYTVSKNDSRSQPMLFLFSPNAAGQVTIVSYDISSFPPQDLKNNNTRLRFDFKKLKVSQSFNKATYTYDKKIDTFLLGPAVTPIPSGGKFILTERISADVLSVMEDVVIKGKSVMPYHTPILYDRI